ncbi:MAG: 5-formyltetrahydrofolate cyclo-ligase [Vampirovibrionales bacterium]
MDYTLEPPAVDAPKSVWRQWAKTVRHQNLTPANTQAIIQHLKHWVVFQQASTLLAFWPTANEIDLRSLLDSFTGKIFLPRITGPKAMAFYAYQPYEPLVQNAYGLQEPPEQAPQWHPTSAKTTTLMIVPALAVDSQGYRLGYGGGYYDTWLAAIKNTAHQKQHLQTVVAVPQALVVNQLPRHDWDVPVDWRVTENGLVATQHSQPESLGL